MRTLKASLIGAVAMIIVLAAPVSAITYGEPDAGEHPYVGFMIFFDPERTRAGSAAAARCSTPTRS